MLCLQIIEQINAIELACSRDDVKTDESEEAGCGPRHHPWDFVGKEAPDAEPILL